MFQRKNRTKLIITLLVLIVALIGGGWMLLTSNGSDSSELTNEQKEIVKIQDERLSKGLKDAPVKIIEYVDILCPYCAKASQPGDIIPSLLDEYVDTNKAHYEVRLVAKTAPDSERAGEGAYCAAEQGAFWQYLDKAYDYTWRQYYSKGDPASEVTMFQANAILNFIKTIPDINPAEWQQCMRDSEYPELMEENADELVKLEAFGTPTMVVDGISYSGVPPYPTFQAVINASLKEKEAAKEKNEEAQ